MASLDSSIRSAARATYSAYKRQPIRWRLAGGSAALTLVILLGFAVIVGTLTTRAIYTDFNRQVSSAADRLGDRLNYPLDTPDPNGNPRYKKRIDLTQREFELLEYLMRNERLVISRQKLLDEVWGYDPFSITNTIEVFVSNLRRKLEAGGEPRLLHTVRGAGYVLRV